MRLLVVRQVPQRFKHLITPLVITPIHQIAIAIPRALPARLPARRPTLPPPPRRQLHVLPQLQRLDDGLHEGQRDVQIPVLRGSFSLPPRASLPDSSPTPPRSDSPPCCTETLVALRETPIARLPRLNNIGGKL